MQVRILRCVNLDDNREDQDQEGAIMRRGSLIAHMKGLDALIKDI